MTGKCIRCGETRADDDLNGLEILADTDRERYRSAYCRELSECDSAAARSEIAELKRFEKYVDWSQLAQ